GGLPARLELGLPGLPLLVALANLLAQDAEGAEGVEEVEVPGRAEEGLGLVLAMDLDQGLGQALEDGQGGVGVVEEDASPSAAHQLPPHDELAVLEREAVLPEDAGHRTLLGDREDALDDGGVRARPDGFAGLDALAEQERQGFDQDRLARPRLAGEDVETGGEGDGQRVDNRQVADPQLFEHPNRPPCRLNARPILAWS